MKLKQIGLRGSSTAKSNPQPWNCDVVPNSPVFQSGRLLMDFPAPSREGKKLLVAHRARRSAGEQHLDLLGARISSIAHGITSVS